VKRRAVEGNVHEMFRLAAAGQGVIASENLSLMYGASLGRVVELPTPRGMLELPVVGVIREYSDQQGSVLIDRALFTAWWQDGSVDLFRVYVQPAATAADVRAEILRRLGSNRRLFVLPNAEVRAYVMNLTDQWFSMTWIQIVIAILVAVLGVVNALTVSIADRRREFGILRAVGGLHGQVRRTIWIEAISIGAVGVLLGLVLGVLQLHYQIEISKRDYPGMQLAYLYPATMALMLFPLITGVALLASLAPAETAVRASLVEALEYE
jgi:putative ABC transport system permease protein